MPSFSRNDVVLVSYPFADRIGNNVRPAVVVSGAHRSRDVVVVPLMSRAERLGEGEFLLGEWQATGHVRDSRSSRYYDGEHGRHTRGRDTGPPHAR